jgi:NAD(P)-dependent dehydrogenase (short-subunit alcohol dehydrogenase family)
MATVARSVVITGGGSGIGRAIAIKLAGRRWRVALMGRNKAALTETATLASKRGVRPLAVTCDISNPEAVEISAAAILSEFGAVHGLVNAAGINVPERRLRIMSTADFRRILETNLFGAYYCTRAFLSTMLKQRKGTIVNISSEAGRQASIKAGTAYTASKFGLIGLNQSINVEERENGIRACCIVLGDVSTPLLDYRPEPPPGTARMKMLRPEDVAACVQFVLSLPMRAVIEEIVLRPRVTTIKRGH